MHEHYQPAVDAFLNYLCFEKRFSQHTVSSYRNDLEQFAAYLQSQYGAPRLQEISPIYIRSWLAELKSDKMTARTINRKISTLKSFFKYHLRTGTLTATPMVSVTAPKISKRLPEFVREEEMRNLFAHMTFPDDWEGRTDHLLLLLFYHTGMRRSELVNLKESQLDLSRQSLKILGKGNKERVLPAGAGLCRALDEYRQAKRQELEQFDDHHLFVRKTGKKLTDSYVYNAVKKYLSQVTTLGKKSPHILRHTFATHMTNNGADLNAVKELLGHSSLAATQVYTHNSIEKLKEAYRKAHPKA
ncbi:MAG: tyrosine-type recombinase/integrase [Bacteroidetes bacterium]|nr:tyrosine-type recombinase/integrase [Bacteroidota bacterium]